jgi:hypothetical protein
MAVSVIDSLRFPLLQGQVEFRTVGTGQTWNVPSGVTSINILAIGGGGGGNNNNESGAGGGGGGLMWRNNLSVIPGQTITIDVGGGGAGIGTGTASSGGDSVVTIGGTSYTAFGGSGGNDTTGGAGGGYNAGYGLNTTGADGGGGQGGVGGDMNSTAGGGGGGAGGYTGNGGAGANGGTTTGSSGTGGGAGGGTSSPTSPIGGGGGTAPYGSNGNGAGGSRVTSQQLGGGGGGSALESFGYNGRSFDYTDAYRIAHGGLYGGGGSGGDATFQTGSCAGGQGVVRIQWDETGNASYPNNAGNLSPTGETPYIVGVEAGEFENGGTSLTLNVPVGTSEGDILLFVAVPDSTAPDIIPTNQLNANFINVYHRDTDGISNQDIDCMAYRVATNSEPSSYSFALSDGSVTDVAAMLVAVRSPLGQESFTYNYNYDAISGGGINILPLTSFKSSGKSLFLAFVTVSGSITRASQTPPTGMTYVANTGTDLNVSCNMSLFSEEIDPGTSTGTRTPSGSGYTGTIAVMFE